MKSKNKIMFMTVAVMAGIFLMIIGVTYTWFNVIIKPEDEASTNVVVKAANLGTITFYNGEEIKMDGAYPGWCETKKVSIKSEGATVASEYSIYLNVIVNELEELGSTYGYVTMKNTVVDAETVITNGLAATDNLQNIIETSGKVVILSAKIGVDETHTYNVEFCFPELGIDQNSQQGKAFNAYLSVATSNIDETESCETAVAFETDSWETISCNIKNGTIAAYSVGDTKEVALDGYGTHTLRIANTSTPDECNTEGFSQSACGFVLEFADILALYNMNPAGTYNGTNYSNGTNIGGWPASTMYKFINGTDDTTYSANTTDSETTSTVKSIYMSLPVALRNIIIDTYTVSGHGKTDTTNFTSTDKLYLLSTAEVWAQGTSSTIDNDTARDETRQLDYYLNLDVSADNSTDATKQYNGSEEIWSLRSADYYNDYYFYHVDSFGDWNSNAASTTNGVSPAFRIG